MCEGFSPRPETVHCSPFISDFEISKKPHESLKQVIHSAQCSQSAYHNVKLDILFDCLPLYLITIQLTSQARTPHGLTHYMPCLNPLRQFVNILYQHIELCVIRLANLPQNLPEF